MTGKTPDDQNTGAQNAGAQAKDKLVKPSTEQSVKEAAQAVGGAAKKAAGLAGDKAAEAKGTAAQGLASVKNEAKNVAGDVAQDAKARGQDLKDTVKEQAADAAEARKQKAASALGTTASDLRRAADVVEESWMTKAMSVAAEQIEDVSRSLENKRPEELVDTARRAAREHPGLFLAGCFAAGVALTRTLKVAQDRAPERLYDGETRRSTDQSFGQGASRDAALTGDRQAGFDTDYASTSASPLGATGANSRAGASSLDRQ